ncbi:MAG: hypothetical protein IKU82_04890 [Clostridia bacterium]|nr:hypothetical protein [Clostridia bacterium]
MYNTKAIAILSAVLGLLFGLCFYIFLGPGELNMWVSIWCAFMFGNVLFAFFLIYEKIMNKRYAKFEKVITSPVFYKTNGNFNLGNGKIKNGNIYFCEAGIVCVCLEEKPYTLDEISLEDIEYYQFDNIHLNIFSKDGRLFIITIPDAKKVIDILKEKDWINF